MAKKGAIYNVKIFSNKACTVAENLFRQNVS